LFFGVLVTAGSCPLVPSLLFFFCVSSTPVIYTLSLHDALPILFTLTNAYFSGFLSCSLQLLIIRPNSAGSLSIYSGTSTCRVGTDRKSTRLNSSHVKISYAVFCLKKKNSHHCRSIVPRSSQTYY